MNYEETLSTLKAIQASYLPMPFLLDPEAEPRFVINSDERTIVIPEEFKFLAVKMDHLSERIYFEIPRYFDGEDLATKICVVQYVNTNGEEAIEGIASIVDVDYTSETDKIIFRWDVDNNATKYAGDVSFSVRFYTISDDNRFTYSWNTVPATLPVLDTLDNTGQTVTENYPTELLQWQYQMTELDRTISEKIADATESIDANVKAAQAARKGAEDAEARVNAIVAGNEAYTKQQSHDLFALALRGTAEAAKSITIYPDKGSNVVATINGFTQQAGTGDPSPTNVRAITNGGLKLVKLALNGTEGWTLNPNSGTAASGSRRFQLGMSVTSSNASAYAVAVAYCSHFDGTTPANTYGSNYDNAFSVQNADLQLRVAGISTVGGLKQFLAARYAAGDPVIVWYQPADESQATSLYAPIILQGGEYRATCLKLNKPLCKGDSVVSYTPSGCDKSVVLNGTENWGAGGLSASAAEKYSRYYIQGMSWARFSSAYVSDYEYYTDVSAYSASRGVGVYGGENTFFDVIVDKASYPSVSEWKAHLAARHASGDPVTFWYRSIDYTKFADIPVSLEKHARTVLVLDGDAGWTWNQNPGAVLYRGYVKAPMLKDSGEVFCSVAKLGETPTTPNTIQVAGGNLLLNLGGYNGADDFDAFKAYLSEKPVTVVAELATPITYAHPAVELPALPDDTGKVTITGQSEGTVSAEFNKSITKAFEDILTRVSALELHALGG